MSLFPLTHGERLTDPARVAAFYRALGERRVSLRGCHTTDPVEIALLVAALDPAHDHTLSFAAGTLASSELETLARTEGYGYLDLRTTTMALRVWPGVQTWAHTPRASGPAQSLSLDEGLERFLAVTPPGIGIVRGFIHGVVAPTKSPLLAFLTKSRVRVDVVLDLDLDSAAELSRRIRRREHDWQAGGVLVDSPSGKIHGFSKSPNTDSKAREQWCARVEDALREARGDS